MKKNQKRLAVLTAAFLLSAGLSATGYAESIDLENGENETKTGITTDNIHLTNGSSLTLSDSTANGTDDTSAAWVTGTGSVLNANNVTFNGGEVAADTSGTINLTGGSVTAPSGSSLYLSSEGGTITTNGTAINTGVSASDGALVTLTNSSIHGDGIDVQGSGSLLTVDGGSSSVGYMNLGDSSETDIKGGNTTDIVSALTVKGGADLTVEGTNTSCTVEGTAHISDGKINITDGGKLVFASGSKLYADETVQTNSSNGIMTAAVLTSRLSAVSDASGSSKGVIHVSTGSSLVFASGSSAYTEAGSDNAVKTIADADAGATVSIDKTAKLYVDNVKTDGSSYDVSSVLTGEGAQGIGWNEIYGDTRLIKGTEESTGLYTFSNQDIGTALPSVCIPHAATQAYLSGSGAAYDFISKALDAKETKTDQAAADSINNAAALTDLGGVSYGTYSFAEDLSGVINDHRSEESHVWADYIRRDLKADGLKAGNLSADYDLSYNGVAVGADFKNTAHHCLGVALAYADGDVHTDGEFASTKNKSRYYGADLYDTARFGSWIFKGDLGYVWSHNDLTQYNAGTRIIGSPHADALMVGIRAEKPIHTGSSTWTPYAGIRYLSLHTDTYTDSLGFRHDTDNAGIWNIPVGVSFRHDFRSGKWTYGPQAAIGGLLAFGDTSANETVSYGSGQDTFGVDVTKNSFIGNVGFYAQKDVLSCGIFYGFQKGSDIRSHQWTVSCSMKF